MDPIGMMYVLDKTAPKGMREVPFYWRRGAVAVTPNIGTTIAEAPDGRFVVSHVMTGGAICLHDMDLPTAIRVAEAIEPLAPWGEKSLDDMARGPKERQPWAMKVGQAIAATLDIEMA